MAKRRRKSVWLGGALVVTLAIGAGTWALIHEVPSAGPWLADTARAVVGPGPVAWAEDVLYGAEDKVNVLVRSDEKPKTFWAHTTDTQPKPGAITVAPDRITPPEPNVATEEDGVWLAFGPKATPFYKTVIHPDKKRPFAAVAVVAMDLKVFSLHAVAGTDEPKSQHVQKSERTGLVPDGERARAMAVFNGGFKAMHGNYGMRLGSAVFVPPRDIACTLGFMPDGSLMIRTFSEIKHLEPSMLGYRQTPPCLVEQGAPNPGLLHEFNRNWGATVGGDTIIRRSAIGLSADKRFLFYALGDATTAQSIGRAMIAVGAHDAAQLDVNYSYPRFLLVDHGEGATTVTAPLVSDVKYSPSDYFSTPSQRDFFYVSARAEPSG